MVNSAFAMLENELFDRVIAERDAALRALHETQHPWIISADRCETVRIFQSANAADLDAADHAGRRLDAQRAEQLDLIRLLRDETNSASVYARCVAIVGERQP